MTSADERKQLSELVRDFLLKYHDSKVRDDDDLEIAFCAGYDARQAEVDELKIDVQSLHCRNDGLHLKNCTLENEVQELKKEVDELRKAKCDHIDQKHRSAAKYEDEIQEIKRLKKDLLLAQLSRNDWESISKNLAVQIQELKKDKDILDFIESSGIDFAKFGSYWCYDGQPNNEPYCASLRVVVGKAMKESKDGK